MQDMFSAVLIFLQIQKLLQKKKKNSIKVLATEK